MATTMNKNKKQPTPLLQSAGDTPHGNNNKNTKKNRQPTRWQRNSQHPHTQQPNIPHWKAPYWTKKSPFELCFKPATDAIALCSSVRVPHSVGILYPTSQDWWKIEAK
jgi:hypothetical protein